MLLIIFIITVPVMKHAGFGARRDEQAVELDAPAVCENNGGPVGHGND